MMGVEASQDGYVYTGPDGKRREGLGVFSLDTGAPVVVGSSAIMIYPTIVVETAIYGAGDILFDFVELPSALLAPNKTSTIQSIVAADKSDIGISISLFFARATADMGVVNAAPSITDADSFSLLGAPVQIAVADWYDLTGNRTASKDNIGRMVDAAAGTSIFMAGLVTAGGTGGTFGATGDLRIGVGLWRNG